MPVWCRASYYYSLNYIVSPAPFSPALGIPPLGRTNYLLTVECFVYTNDVDSLPDLSGSLQSVASGDSELPFSQIVNTPVFQLYGVTVTPTADALFQDFTLTWPNATVSYHMDFAPLFLKQPQDQSAFLGNTITFTAQAIHTTGYQWQKDGTNLVEDGHYIGVTNGTLVISNVQPADAGSYALAASHPVTPGVSASATLSVYKPMRLALFPMSAPDGFELQVANQDGSPIEDTRIPNLQILSTTNLVPVVNSQPIQGGGITINLGNGQILQTNSIEVSTSTNTTPATISWNLETNAIASSNGVLHVFFPADCNGAKFWRVQEQ